VLAISGTILFRYLLERRVGSIRQTVEEIEAGNLTKRIPLAGVEDEFSRLSHEMNHMLDRIEHLMDGVRHVSNTIAHNLRTPLGRIRGHLDEAIRAPADTARLAEAAEFSIEQVDALIIILDKLLQIAESESGTRRRPFEAVSLREVITNVVELYDAIAEEQGITLFTKIEGDPKTFGDRDLLASALANLLDNALKYGGRSVVINVSETPERGTVSMVVQDNGPGIPPEERPKVTQRFYRLDQSVPGTGLGLSIVAAIAHLHGAALQLEDAFPGLLVRVILPLSVSN
jgi:signal transduction histidine kinase